MLHTTPPLASQPANARPTGEPGFAARLREATKAVHVEAERSGFIADLVRGRATREGYAVYLRNLVPIYATLEAVLSLIERPSPLLAVFADPALRRLSHLLADLAAVAGPAWKQICPVLPEAELYARSIVDADDVLAAPASSPLAAHAESRFAAQVDGKLAARVDEKLAARVEGKLVAHAYARYLGDLSGGQILRPLLTRSLGLGPPALTFYSFPAFGDVETAKRRIREALDAVPPAGDLADAIVAEAISAFRHNIALSTSVSDTLRSVAV